MFHVSPVIAVIALNLWFITLSCKTSAPSATSDVDILDAESFAGFTEFAGYSACQLTRTHVETLVSKDVIDRHYVNKAPSKELGLNAAATRPNDPLNKVKP